MTADDFPAAEALQADAGLFPADDPAVSRADFWCGFIAGAGTVLFWLAVGAGVWLAAIRNFITS